MDITNAFSELMSSVSEAVPYDQRPGTCAHSGLRQLIKAARIRMLSSDWTLYCSQYSNESPAKVDATLYEGYTPDEWREFSRALNVDYDSGYGTQYLFGTVWLADGSWLERKEYDGAEAWEHKKLPQIPQWNLWEEE